MRTVRKDIAGPSMKSLTFYQANRTRVGVRRDTAGPGMKSPTSCQAKTIRAAEGTVRRDTTGSDLAWNHSHTVKPTGPESQ